MTKPEAMTTILDQLHAYDFNPTEFDSKALETALEVFGENSVAIEDDYGYALDLAAALDYFGGNDALTVDDFATALKKAVDTVDLGDYTFDADISTTYDLGEFFFYKKTNARYGIEWQDYVDFERLGEDIAGDTKGKFTRYGFFAPEAI